MCENVHEWCSDWFDADYYAISPERNPQGPEEGTRKASRGGSWRHHIKVSHDVRRVQASRRNSNTLIMASGSSAMGRSENSLAGITDAIGMKEADEVPGLSLNLSHAKYRQSCRQSGAKSTWARSRQTVEVVREAPEKPASGRSECERHPAAASFLEADFCGNAGTTTFPS